MRIVKRTFEAKNHEKGSQARAKLNLDWRTSEYLPSMKYGVEPDEGEGLYFVFPTKKEAEQKAIELLTKGETNE